MPSSATAPRPRSSGKTTLLDHRRGVGLPPDQRRDAVAADGDLPDPQGELRARLRADRALDLHLPGARPRCCSRRSACIPTSGRCPIRCRWAWGASLVGLIVLGFAQSYWLLLLGSALVGLGSAIFHPESSRVARLASGGRHGLAQSLFQVGGNVGSAIGPLLAAFVVLPQRAVERQPGSPSARWSASSSCGGSAPGMRRIGGPMPDADAGQHARCPSTGGRRWIALDRADAC